VLIRRLAGPVLVCVLGLVVLGAVRSVALVRRSPGAGWREAVGAFGLWLGLGWVVALASVRGLLADEGTFLRTPKTRGNVGWRDAFRGNVVETGLALLCLAGAGFAATAGTLGAVVVTVLLSVQAAGYAAAPLNSLAAITAHLTPELARHRRETLLAWTRVRPVVRRAGVAPVVALALLGVAVVALAGPVGGPDLGSVPGAAAPHLARPSRSPSPRPSTGPRQAGRTTGPGQSASVVAVPPATTPAPSVFTSASSRPSSAATTSVSRPSSRPSATPSTRQTVHPTPTSTPTTRATGRPTTAPTHPAGPSGKPTSKPTHP
jgi:hypothetical protein